MNPAYALIFVAVFAFSAMGWGLMLMAYAGRHEHRVMGVVSFVLAVWTLILLISKLIWIHYRNIL